MHTPFLDHHWSIMKIVKNILKTTLTILICVLAVALGYLAGTKISDNNFKIDRYAGLSVEELADDFSKINYEGKTPDQLTAVEAYLVAIDKLENQNHYKKTVFGEMATNIGLTQYIDLCSEKTDDTYDYAFVTTSSMFTSAVKTTYKKGDDMIMYQGTPSGNTLDTVTWTNESQSYTYDEYSEIIGREPTHESSYIVSSKTILSASECVMENGTYTYSLTMHPTLSTFTYINEIAYRAKSDKTSIKVNSITLEFTVDSSFTLINEHHIENYSFKFSGIPVTLNADYIMNINY